MISQRRGCVLFRRVDQGVGVADPGEGVKVVFAEAAVRRLQVLLLLPWRVSLVLLQLAPSLLQKMTLGVREEERGDRVDSWVRLSQGLKRRRLNLCASPTRMKLGIRTVAQTRLQTYLRNWLRWILILIQEGTPPMSAAAKQRSCVAAMLVMTRRRKLC